VKKAENEKKNLQEFNSPEGEKLINKGPKSLMSG